MYRLIIYVAISIFWSINTFSQTTLDLLTANVWVKNVNFQTDKEFLMVFDEVSYYTITVEGNKGKYLPVHDFYLSDTMDEVFDESKIGKQKDGKYLICRFINKKDEITLIEPWEILTINEKEFLFKRSPLDPFVGHKIQNYSSYKKSLPPRKN